jgi:hypothetical protein
VAFLKRQFGAVVKSTVVGSNWVESRLCYFCEMALIMTFSVPQLLHLENGDNIAYHRFLVKTDEVTYVKHVESC